MSTDAEFNFSTNIAGVADELVAGIAKMDNALRSLRDGGQLSAGVSNGLGEFLVPPKTFEQLQALNDKVAGVREEMLRVKADTTEAFSSLNASRVLEGLAQVEAAYKRVADAAARADAFGAGRGPASRLSSTAPIESLYGSYDEAGIKAADQARANAVADREETAAIEARIAAKRRDVEATFAQIDADRKTITEYQNNHSFMGGVQRGANRHGSTFGSNLGYELARQSEFGLSLGAQFLAYDGLRGIINNVGEYQKGRQDLNVAAMPYLGANAKFSQNYLNSLANQSRLVGENPEFGFDSAASGIRAFAPLLPSGLQGDQLRQAIEAIGTATNTQATRLGVLTGEGQNKATDQIIGIGSSYNVGAQGLSQVNDAIAYAKNNIGGEMKDIADGLAKSADGAKAAGYSMNDAANAIALIQTRTAESGEAAGTGFSRVLQAVVGANGSKLAGKYAVSGYASPEDTKILEDMNASGMQRMKAFADIYKKADQQTQNQLLADIGGRQNRAQAAVLLSEGDLLNSQNAKADNGGAMGQGAAQFQRLMQNLHNTLLTIRGDLRSIGSDIGNSGIGDIFGVMLKGVDPLLKGLDEILRGFGELDQMTGHLSGLTLGAGLLAGGGKAVSAYRAAGSDKKAAEDAAYREALARQSAATMENTAALIANTEGRIAGGLEGGLLGPNGKPLAKEAGLLEEAAPELGMLGKMKSFLGFGGATEKYLGGMKGIGAGLALGLGGDLIGGQAGSVLSAAGTGATLGSFIGPEGTLIGGLLGGGLGLAESLFGGGTNANENLLQQTQAVAQQQVATGNFADAVRTFEAAANNFKTKGDNADAATAASAAAALKHLPDDHLGALVQKLGTINPINGGATKADMALTGIYAQHQISRLEGLAVNAKPANAADNFGQAFATAAFLGGPAQARSMMTWGPTGAPSWLTQAPNLQGDAQFHDSSYTPAQAEKLRETLAKQVTDYIKKNGIDPYKDLPGTTQKAVQQLLQTSSIELAGGKIGNVDTSKLTQSIAGIFTGQYGSDSLAHIMDVLNVTKQNAIPYLIAEFQAQREAALKGKATDSALRSMDLTFAKSMLKYAGDDPGLIAQIFGAVDAATVNKIIQIQNQAVTVDQAAAKTANDIANAMSSLGKGGLFGGILSGIGTSLASAANAQLAKDKQLANDYANAKSVQIPAALPAMPKAPRGGGAGHQYDYVKSAVAEARAARAGGADIAAAQAALQAAQDQMQHNATGSAAWWRGYAALWQAKQQLVKAEAQAAETNFLLTQDFTDPAIQALAKARSALTTWEQDKKLGFSAEAQAKDRLAYLQASAAATKTKEDQVLQQYQTQEQLGLISHAAYIQYLESQKKIMESMKHRTYDQTQYMYQIDQALKQANDSTNAMWNIGDISTNGLVAQVRAIGDLVQQVSGLKALGGDVGSYRPKQEIVVTIKGLPAGVKATSTTKSPLTTTTRNPSL